VLARISVPPSEQDALNGALATLGYPMSTRPIIRPAGCFLDGLRRRLFAVAKPAKARVSPPASPDRQRPAMNLDALSIGEHAPPT
jgi:hypothetical protein